VADSRRAWATALLRALPDEASRESAARALEGAAAALVGGSGGYVEAFFRDPAVPRDAKAEALASLYAAAAGSGPDGDGARKVFSRYVALIVEKGRVPLIPAIAETFRAFLDRERGIVRLDIASARDLGESTLGRIAEAWKRASGAGKVEVRASLDPALLGGFILRTGSVRYDWSTSGRFKRLGRELSRPLAEAPGTERGQ